MNTAMVTGPTGQDGSYLIELLGEQGYRIVGLVRPGSPHSASINSALPANVRLVEWDMRDQDALEQILADLKPKEFYNFAAYSTGSGMYDEPVAIGDVNGLAVARILEALRRVDRTIRFCQASSSELFGEPLATPQTEETPFNPRSPYGAAKLYAHSMINIYRKRFGLFACSAILFNHESPQRGLAFVTRKITHAAASIRLGLAGELQLGNLDARRDWGFAGDYVRAMWLMLQAPEPSDYVVATGKTWSVRDFCDIAFARVGLDYRDYVRLDAATFRTPEALQLVGDPSKAARVLRWIAETDFPSLVHMMVDADFERLRPIPNDEAPSPSQPR